MMRKLVLVCVLLMAVAASASAGTYQWNLLCTDTSAGMAGAQVRIGVKTAVSTSQQDWSVSTVANCASVNYTGGLDSTMVKSDAGLLKTDYRTVDPTAKWIFEAWTGTGYTGGTMDVRIWGSTSSYKPSGSWKLYKLYDPLANEGQGAWGKTELGTVPIATSTGTADSPWFKYNLAVSGNVKTSAPSDYGKGYILSLEIPEPGSMVAMLSGLVGLVGFGIRRRR